MDGTGKSKVWSWGSLHKLPSRCLHPWEMLHCPSQQWGEHGKGQGHVGGSSHCHRGVQCGWGCADSAPSLFAGKTFQCPTLGCMETFPSMQDLMAHMKVHYKPNRYFK